MPEPNVPGPPESENPTSGEIVRRQRVASYAVVVRDEQVLLSKIAPRISPEELWTLPGGGVEHGEDPRLAAVREVYEETGLEVAISTSAYVYSWHDPHAEREGATQDFHAVRIVFEGWVPPDSPEPHVVEVDGSTVEAAWHRLESVLAGQVPITSMVLTALADLRPTRRQRVSVYAVITEGDSILLTRMSARTVHPGSWTLPGGGIEHGESPADALRREVAEECGASCMVGELLGVHDTHFTGAAPSGRREDYHGIHLIYAGSLPPHAQPQVAHADDTTDAVAWVPITDVTAGQVDVLDVVRYAMDIMDRQGSTP